MDDYDSVFIIASDGDIYDLQDILDNKSQDEVKDLVSAYTDGATPLTIACRNGHSGIVAYLIDECHADVEQLCCINDKEGSPMFWAVSFGHFDIVEMLIEYKASVNGVGESTAPLIAASKCPELKIAKYLIEKGADVDVEDKEGYTCLMHTCIRGEYEFSKYLIECGVSVNKKNKNGKTALHMCVKSGCKRTIRILIQHRATMSVDDNGLTPLLYAVFIRPHTDRQQVVRYLINKFNCTKQDKIDALELLGASYADDERYSKIACGNWKLAMKLRNEDSAFPLEKSDCPLSSHIGAEVRSFEQLDELLDDTPGRRNQALLVRVRILGPGHPLAINFIRSRAKCCGASEMGIRLELYILDEEVKNRESVTVVLDTLLNLTGLFDKKVEFQLIPEEISFRLVLRAFEGALAAIETAMNESLNRAVDHSHTSALRRILTLSLRLVSIMCNLKAHLGSDEDNSLRKATRQLVLMNPKRDSGSTALHIACSKKVTFIILIFVPGSLSPEVVNLLLEVGACPNAADLNNNTPLHLVAMNRPFDKNLFYSLLTHGAHLGLRNNENRTPLQLVPDTFTININPTLHLNLQCLCALVINNHKVPKKLREFLDCHC